jgi:type II secretory pathway component PulM
MMNWWTSRAPRERILLGAAAFIALFAALVQFIVLPAIAQREDARARVSETSSTLVRLERLQAAGIIEAPVTPPADPETALFGLAGEFDLTVSQSAEEAAQDGFVLTAADPQQLFAWIAAAETRLGLRVSSAELTAAEAGRVNAVIKYADVAVP